MFVSESTLNFMGTKLQLISTEGHSWETAVDPSATVDNVKKLAIQYFYPGDEATVVSEQFRGKSNINTELFRKVSWVLLVQFVIFYIYFSDLSSWTAYLS